MEQDLAKLGLAPATEMRRGIPYTVIPAGRGWCQAVYAPPEAWPPGAEVCAIVRWRPDAAFRRDRTTGRVPAGAEIHWKLRTRAMLRDLEAAGYLAVVSGPPRSPRLHPHEDILIWRLGPGAHWSWPPHEAWDGMDPARPNHQREYRPRARDPWALLSTTLGEYRVGSDHGRALAESIDAVLWPQQAEYCARVRWQPHPKYQRRPGDDHAPPGAAAHWKAGVHRLTHRLTGAGYRVRTAEHPASPDRDDEVGLLVWRGPLPFSYDE
ncbi:hypothetical protein AB0C52_24080 [Streptomyces sp. NPDC048717]|uniref:hypothetical protein n=1 Tax=Streptomyces sp. NPDC048717 TaxID=3154928 RepID=UPI0034372AD4